MNETRSADGLPPQKKGSGDKESVDSEKFQKALRVEKSEEIDKREKRNRPKQQEELENEVDDVGASIPVPQGIFKEYMKEDKKTSSVFDAGVGTKATLTSDSSNSSSSFKDTYSGNLEDGQKSTISVGAPSPSSSDQESPPDDGDSSSSSSDDPVPQISQPSAPTDASIQFPSFDDELPETPETTDSQSTDETQNPSTPVKAAKEKKVAAKKVSAKKVSEKTVEATTPPSAKQVAEKKVSPPPKEAEAKESSEKIGSSVSDTVVKKKEPSTRDDKEERKVVPLVVNREMGDSEKDSNNKGEDTVAAIAPPISAANVVPALAMSPFSNMPKDVFDVFEKMVGMMTVQKDSGKSVTTITLNMPNSVFN